MTYHISYDITIVWPFLSDPSCLTNNDTYWTHIVKYCRVLTNMQKNMSFVKRVCRISEKCSEEKHKWYCGIAKTYNIDICNIKHIVYRYFYELVHPIGINIFLVGYSLLASPYWLVPIGYSLLAIPCCVIQVCSLQAHLATQHSPLVKTIDLMRRPSGPHRYLCTFCKG